jgi:tRNA A-37 threonylcarbamoyl transferase component Bud32
MAQASEGNKTHTLHFTYDEDDTCALTVLVNDVRFHVVIDPKDMQKSREKPLYYEYLDKLYSLRDAERLEHEKVEKQQLVEKNQQSNDKDSAIDMTADSDPDADQDSPSAALELHNWILSAFTDTTAQYAPPDREPIDSTLYEWYHGPTYFYSLQIKAGRLEPELLETTEDMNKCIENLVPRLKMPKYIQEINLPWHNANDLSVQSEIDFPEPAHPGKVTHDKTGECYFFKPVVADQPGPVKREISILQKLGKLGLDTIKVPKLLGFVAFENSHTEIMGILLECIDEPEPLTKLLSSTIPKSKRDTWSRKSEQYVQVLHDNDIIWGDAKADNFVVDKYDELWIIDFGGSYTEGWVDPELSETVEGDDMGVGKVVKALENPEKNTFEPVGRSGEVKETASGLFVTERVDDVGGKRKRDKEEEGREDEKKMKTKDFSRESAGEDAEYVETE